MVPEWLFLGYCPGTMAISLGEGSLDALIGIVGGLTGGLVYTLWLPSFKSILGPNLGSISLNSLLGANQMLFFLVLFIIGGLFIGVSFWLHKMDRAKDFKWLISGIGLAI